MADDLTKKLQEIADQIAIATAAIAKESEKNQKLSGAEKKQSTDELKRLNTALAALVAEQSDTKESLKGLNSLSALTQTLKDQKAAADKDLSLAELGNKLDSLNSLTEGNAASEQLKNEFAAQRAILENPVASEEEKKLAQETIDIISEGAESEENRREAQRKADEANSILLRIAEGSEEMAKGLDDFASNFSKGAGLLGTLGAIGMLLFSPETLKEMIDNVINFFSDMTEAVTSLLDGDFENAKELILKNWKGVAAAIGGFFVLFGGTIMSAVGGIFKSIKAIGGFLGKFGKVLGKLFVPFTVIMGAVSFITGFIDGFKEEGIIGGLQEGIKNLFDNLVAAPLDLLKDGVAWILGKMGFENAAETVGAFSFSDLFSSMFDSVFGFIGSSVDWVKGKFSELAETIPEIFSTMWSGLFGEGGLYDMLFAPIDMVVNWVSGMFGFEIPEDGFSLREFIGNQISAITDYIRGLFDFDFFGGDEELAAPPEVAMNATDEEIMAQARSNVEGFFGGVDEDEALTEFERLRQIRNQQIQASAARGPQAFVDSQMASPSDFTAAATANATERMLGREAAESLELSPQEFTERAMASRAPDSQLIQRQNEIDNIRAEMEAMRANAAPVVINGGGGSGGRNVNASSQVVNISQGMSASDMSRMEFVNFPR